MILCVIDVVVSVVSVVCMFFGVICENVVSFVLSYVGLNRLCLVFFGGGVVKYGLLSSVVSSVVWMVLWVVNLLLLLYGLFRWWVVYVLISVLVGL